MLYTAEEEIRDVSHGKPHLVILGAGASLAAFPDGDRNGSRLPLMDNLVEVLDLESDLDRWSVEHGGLGFETIYSGIADDPALAVSAAAIFPGDLSRRRHGHPRRRPVTSLDESDEPR